MSEQQPKPFLFCTDPAARLNRGAGPCQVETDHPGPLLVNLWLAGGKLVGTVSDLTTGRASYVEGQAAEALLQQAGLAGGGPTQPPATEDRGELAGWALANLHRDALAVLRYLLAPVRRAPTERDVRLVLRLPERSARRRFEELRRAGLIQAPARGRRGGVRLTTAGARLARALPPPVNKPPLK
jgi:hypothetical protein